MTLSIIPSKEFVFFCEDEKLLDQSAPTALWPAIVILDLSPPNLAAFWYIHLSSKRGLVRISQVKMVRPSFVAKHNDQLLHANLGTLCHVVGFKDATLTRIELMFNQNWVLDNNILRIRFLLGGTKSHGIDAFR